MPLDVGEQLEVDDKRTFHNEPVIESIAFRY
jgi:hypothetical protein